MKRRECPRCKSHLIKEVNESEVLHVSKKRMHVYNSVRKGILCLVCGYRDIRFGVKYMKRKTPIEQLVKDKKGLEVSLILL